MTGRERRGNFGTAQTSSQRDLLLDANALGVPGFGQHSLTLPPQPVWLGPPIFAQGARIDGSRGIAQVVVLNAVDAVVGL